MYGDWGNIGGGGGGKGGGIISTWKDRMDLITGAQIRFKMGDLPGHDFLDWIGLQWSVHGRKEDRRDKLITGGKGTVSHEKFETPEAYSFSQLNKPSDRRLESRAPPKNHKNTLIPRSTFGYFHFLMALFSPSFPFSFHQNAARSNLG